jgi:hypothetical protein
MNQMAVDEEREEDEATESDKNWYLPFSDSLTAARS